VDTDADGIPDYLDLDSDNDGLTDTFEAGGSDVDGDGIVDNFVDADNDGLDDGVAALPLPDADGDGFVDADNDGLSDIFESGQAGADVDGDGQVDAPVDANGDGLADNVTANDITDFDGDGASNHLDLDSDGDGTNDLTEAGGDDADGDGQVDGWADHDDDGIPDNVDFDLIQGADADGDGIDDSADADFVNIPDSDGDGIVDTFDSNPFGDGFIPVSQAASPEPDPEGAIPDGLVVTGVSGHGCSVGDPANTTKDPAFIGMSLMAMFMLFFQGLRRRVAGSAKLTALLVALGLMSGCSTMQPADSSAATNFSPENVDDRYNDRIKRHVYVGIGLGKSHLNPDTSASTSFNVNDRVQNAGSLNIGVDLSRQVAIEAQAVRLGSAGFSPTGSISYEEYSASALFYAGKNRGRFKRRGLSAFGRLGAGALVNNTDGVPYEQANGVHFLVGLGAEYMTRSGLGLRAEYINYESDINYGQLGLIYRFGKQKRRERIETVEATPVVEPIAEPIEEAPVVAAALPVDNTQCLALNGVLDGVNFHSDSAQLTDTSVEVLQGISDTLNECDSTSITISAHTDSVGAESYNEALSQRRADSVLEFFNGNGIATDRMQSIAYGEREPIDTNKTSDGRRNNRRVELFID